MDLITKLNLYAQANYRADLHFQTYPDPTTPPTFHGTLTIPGSDKVATAAGQRSLRELRALLARRYVDDFLGGDLSTVNISRTYAVKDVNDPSLHHAVLDHLAGPVFPNVIRDALRRAGHHMTDYVLISVLHRMWAHGLIEPRKSTGEFWDGEAPPLWARRGPIRHTSVPYTATSASQLNGVNGEWTNTDDVLSETVDAAAYRGIPNTLRGRWVPIEEYPETSRRQIITNALLEISLLCTPPAGAVNLDVLLLYNPSPLNRHLSSDFDDEFLALLSFTDQPHRSMPLVPTHALLFGGADYAFHDNYCLTLFDANGLPDDSPGSSERPPHPRGVSTRILPRRAAKIARTANYGAPVQN